MTFLWKGNAYPPMLMFDLYPMSFTNEEKTYTQILITPISIKQVRIYDDISLERQCPPANVDVGFITIPNRSKYVRITLELKVWWWLYRNAVCSARFCWLQSCRVPLKIRVEPNLMILAYHKHFVKTQLNHTCACICLLAIISAQIFCLLAFITCTLRIFMFHISWDTKCSTHTNINRKELDRSFDESWAANPYQLLLRSFMLISSW